jgi:two-component system nitrogen regulation sensor histidine kinase NtrY
MVSEFSAFARMPEPVMKQEDVARHLRDLLVLQQQAHTDIDFTLPADGEPVVASVDAQQVRQAFTNIVQNAVDAIQARKDREPGFGGRIDVSIIRRPENSEFVIVVSDNGIGLPKDEDVNRLTEPYVTHREKGTGLGLAIVKKIMEDHKGRIVIGAPEWIKAKGLWNDPDGATVCLVFPLDTPAKRIEQHDAAA